MSLEEALLANTAAILEQNKRLDAMLAKAGAATTSPATAADAGDEKPRRTSRKPKEDTKAGDDGKDDDGDKLSIDDVKKTVGAWLGEFKSDENDPETGARRDAIKAALAKLVGKEGAQVADVPADDLPRVIAWVDKQKAKDNGFGVGRLTAAPGDDDSGDGDDDI